MQPFLVVNLLEESLNRGEVYTGWAVDEFEVAGAGALLDDGTLYIVSVHTVGVICVHWASPQ